MDRRRRSLIFGGALLGVFAVGMLLLAAAWHIDRAYRHVVVEVHNVNDVGWVNVNCQRVVSVSSDDSPRTIDLGYLSPDDRVSLSGFNEIGDAAWGFRVISNGHTVFDRERGRAQAAGFPADEHAVVMAESLTADGDMLGMIGCDPLLLVSPELVSYQRSPDNPAGDGEEGVREQWRSPDFPYALIEGVADWVLPVLALIGFAVALATPEVRALVRRHWKISLISLAIALAGLLLNLWRQFGLDGLILSVELFGGVGLLLFAAVVNIWVGLVLGGVVTSRWLSSDER